MAKSITLLGSTGSIGTQSLDVARSQGYTIRALAAHSNVDRLLEQIGEFHPRYVAVADPAACRRLRDALADQPGAPRVLEGADGIVTLAGMGEADVVLNAVVGIAGLGATLAALESGCDVALANKESLVTGGYLVTKAAKDHGAKLLPVDSEHSAIFQCLNGQDVNRVKRILLTASGGPFRNFSKEQLANVTAAEALKHPKWTMGAKITIDSATMMNKGFEMIEARHLYNVAPKDIQIVIHPESIVHSAVEFADGAVIAQLGVPDMRLPIQYALGFPHRLPLPQAETLDLFQIGTLHFEAPDPERFPCIRFAYDSIERGGNIPCVLNAAAEVTNEAFRKGLCTYPQMHTAIEQVLQQADFIANPQLDDLFQTDDWARRRTTEVLQTNATPQS